MALLNVSAKDLATGKEQKITITASSGLSKYDVVLMTSYQVSENRNNGPVAIHAKTSRSEETNATVLPVQSLICVENRSTGRAQILWSFMRTSWTLSPPRNTPFARAAIPATR